MSDQKREWSLVTSAEFKEILAEANRAIDAVNQAQIRPTAAGFAGLALIRQCIKLTGGDVEWWVDLVRRGPKAIVDSAFYTDGPAFTPPPPREKQ